MVVDSSKLQTENNGGVDNESGGLQTDNDSGGLQVENDSGVENDSMNFRRRTAVVGIRWRTTVVVSLGGERQ